MSHLSGAQVRVYPDPAQVSVALAAALLEQMRRAAREHGRCALVLAGGNTPRELYRRLAELSARDPLWRQVEVFFSDERWVGHQSEASNYRMAREALLQHVPIPARQVHPIATDAPDPAQAAAQYERLLRRADGDVRRLDVVLLGMGADGHTASLFPGAPALAETRRLVLATRAPVAPHQRITMTFPAINTAAEVHFLVTGAGKAQMVARALDPATPVTEVPAAGVRPTCGCLTWWLDEPAASGLTGGE